MSLRRVALLCALLVAGPASAAVRCIDSDVQVKPVLDAALASAETTEDVRIKGGNYFFSTGQFGYFGVLEGNNKTLTISGGWSGAAGQCTTRGNDPSATLFWGLNQRQVFGINASTTFTGNVIVENMSFGGGHTASGSSASCLSLGEQNGGMMGIRVDRIRVEGCTAAPGLSLSAVQLGSSVALMLRNSLIAGNDVSNGSAVGLNLKGGVGYALNNTIALNTSANINGYVGLTASNSGGTSLTVTNNLFDLNSNTVAPRIDIRVGNGVTLVNNRFSGLDGIPVSNTGSSTGPAGFGGNDYELARTSPARDAGAAFAALLQGTLDVYGRPRVTGSAVDLGAAEFALLFADGFE